MGHPSPMILSLSQAWHPFLPPAAALHSRAHRLVTLFSLVCKVCRAVALQGEEGHLGALIGDQTESVGIASNHPWEVGKLWVLPLPLVIPNPEERGSHSWCGVPHLGGMLFLHSHMSESPNPVSPNCQLPTPMGSKCNPVRRRDGASWDPTRLCPKKGSCVPGVGIPAAPELWGQARRCRSVLGGWCSRPTRCSRFGLGLHVLYTGQDFLLVSCQSDSNSEQVPGRRTESKVRPTSS